MPSCAKDMSKSGKEECQHEKIKINYVNKFLKRLIQSNEFLKKQRNKIA